MPRFTVAPREVRLSACVVSKGCGGRSRPPLRSRTSAWHSAQLLASTRAACGSWQVWHCRATPRWVAPVWKGTFSQSPWQPAVVHDLSASSGFTCVCGLWHMPQVPPCGSVAGSKSVSTSRMAWQPRHSWRAGRRVPAAESRVASAGTSALKLWQTLQWSPVWSAMPPRRMSISSVRWQPCWAQVLSAGWKRCAERAWQVRQAISSLTRPPSKRAAIGFTESDSKWVRWPAVAAMACQVSLAAPWTWHCSQTSRGTFPCGGTSSGRSMIQKYISRACAASSKGWQAWQLSVSCLPSSALTRR